MFNIYSTDTSVSAITRCKRSFNNHLNFLRGFGLTISDADVKSGFTPDREFYMIWDDGLDFVNEESRLEFNSIIQDTHSSIQPIRKKDIERLRFLWSLRA